MRCNCKPVCNCATKGGVQVAVIGAGNLSQQAASLYANIEDWARRRGIAAPILLSACRSAELQQQLRESWDRGDRAGIAVRPADPSSSRHVPDASGTCNAFDLGNTPAWLTLCGNAVATLPNVTWGGVWIPKDINHFQINRR